MHIIARTLLVVVFTVASQVHAANCRSGDAAARGGEAGFQRDKNAAEATARDESNKSETLSKCLGSITAVVTTPQFPSLGQVYDQIKKRICKIARDQINGVVRAANDRVQDGIDTTINDPVNGVINRADDVIDGTIRDATGGRISNPNLTDAIDVPRVSGPALNAASEATGTDFWRKIWN